MLVKPKKEMNLSQNPPQLGRPTNCFRQNTWGAFPLLSGRGAELVTSSTMVNCINQLTLTRGK